MARSISGAVSQAAVVGHCQVDHLDTLRTRSKRATQLEDACDFTAAVAERAALVPRLTAVLGADDPGTLAERCQLLWAQYNSGDVPTVMADLEEFVPHIVQVLGNVHPTTVDARVYLAWSQGETGDPNGAAVALLDLLTDYVSVHGPNDRNARQIAGWLVHWHRIVRGDPPQSDSATPEGGPIIDAQGVDT